MKTICSICMAVLMLLVAFPCAGDAQSGSTNADVIEKAKIALHEWKARPGIAPAPVGCERCVEISKKIGDVDSRSVPLADGMELLVKDIMTVGADNAGAEPLKQLSDATSQLEGNLLQRDTLVAQYRSEVEKFKMRKWRPDDSRQREEMRYYNPTRPR